MPQPPSNGAIVLLSGGLDSTVALAEILQDCPVACVLTFDYGQRAAKQELRATRAIADHYQLNHRVIALPWLADLLPQALSATDPDWLPDSVPGRDPNETQWDALSVEQVMDVNAVWVPNRNGLFINIAACFAEAMNVKNIVFGANAEEGVDFPDNTPAFRDQLNQVFGFSTLTGVTVETPVGNLQKKDIIERGLKLNVPFHLIWSCYENGERQCGKCPSCVRLKAARDQASTQTGQSAQVVFQGE